MGKQLTTTIAIDATPDRVWQVLTDFAAYSQWNPFITSAEGDAVEGGQLTLRMQPVGARVATFRPTVLEATANHRFRWLGRLGVPGDLRW